MEWLRQRFMPSAGSQDFLGNFNGMESVFQIPRTNLEMSWRFQTHHNHLRSCSLYLSVQKKKKKKKEETSAFCAKSQTCQWRLSREEKTVTVPMCSFIMAVLPLSSSFPCSLSKTISARRSSSGFSLCQGWLLGLLGLGRWMQEKVYSWRRERRKSKEVSCSSSWVNE